MEHLLALPTGYQIDEYKVLRILGSGGFGITYLGEDIHLGKQIAIKEYLPNDLAIRVDGTTVLPKSSADKSNFEWGLERFIDEARVLARFDHPNLVKVHRYFERHGTGYIVMEYVQGITLDEHLKKSTKLSISDLKPIIQGILNGLEQVHSADFLHRDIKPGNIIIRDNGDPMLIDFGSARAAIGARSQSVTSIVTPGYAPLEQYATKSSQGPWTDIYSLGAVMYRCITGKAPPDATSRAIEDEFIQLKDISKEDDKNFINAIDWALELKSNLRPQSIVEWKAELLEYSPVSITEQIEQVTQTLKIDKKPIASVKNVPIKTTNKNSSRPYYLLAILCVIAGISFYIWNSGLIRNNKTENTTVDIESIQMTNNQEHTSELEAQNNNETENTAVNIESTQLPSEQTQITESEADEVIQEIETKKNDDEIIISLEELELANWKRISKSSNPDDFSNFISNNPNGKFFSLAMAKFKTFERNAWEAALKANTNDSYELFIKKFPDSAFVSLAKVKIN